MEKNMLDTEKTDKVYLNFLETFYNEKLELFEKAEEPQKPKEADDEELKEHEKKVSLQLSNKVNPLKHSTFRVISQNSEDRSLGGNVTSIGTSSGGPTLYDFNKKHWKHIIPLLIYNILERADDDKFLDLESILKIRNSPMLRQFFFSRDVRNNPEAKNIKYYLDPRLFVIISKKIWFGLDKFLAEHSTVKKLFKTLVIKGKIDNVQKNVILGGTIIFTSYLKTCEEVYKMKKHGTTIV